MLNTKQEIEPRSSVSVTDTGPVIGANVCFFFIQQKLRYLIANPRLFIGHTLFFCEEGRKNSRLNNQKDNTTSRDTQSDPNLTDTTKNCNKSVISIT